MVANLKRLASVYLPGVGAMVAVHFIVTRFYDPAWEDASLAAWSAMNPLQVSGVVIALVVAFMRKRRLDGNASDQSVSREYLESNVLFYSRRRFSWRRCGTGSACSGPTRCIALSCCGSSSTSRCRSCWGSQRSSCCAKPRRKPANEKGATGL